MTALLLAISLAGPHKHRAATPAPAPKSEPMMAQRGPSTPTFQLAGGKIIVYLPQHIAPGDKISGSVFVQPAGADWNQQHDNLVWLEDCKLQANSTEVKINSTIFSIQTSPSDMDIKLAIIGRTGNQVAQMSISLESRAAMISPDYASAPVIQQGRPLRIVGPFDGDRNTTFASINGHGVGVLAEGPGECYITSPVENTGPIKLHVGKHDREFDQQVNVIGFTFMAPAFSTKSGKLATVGVEVDGLQDLPRTAYPVTVQLTTENPDIMQFQGGDPKNFTLWINPGEVSSGHFLQSVPMLAKHNGTYTINGSVASGGYARTGA